MNPFQTSEARVLLFPRPEATIAPVPAPAPAESKYPVHLMEVMGDDLMVVNAARVSMDKRKSRFEPKADTRLINFLARDSHFTPFAHPQIQFMFEMPIFVERQWNKHRVGLTPLPAGELETGLNLPWLLQLDDWFGRLHRRFRRRRALPEIIAEPTVVNEVSRRYVSSEPRFYTPDAWRLRAENVKQGSGDDASLEVALEMNQMLDETHTEALARYERGLARGIAAEHLRMLLPLTLYTSFYETGSLAAWARVAHLRLDPTAQYETRRYAVQVDAFLRPRFPISWAALMGEPVEPAQAARFLADLERDLARN